MLGSGRWAGEREREGKGFIQRFRGRTFRSGRPGHRDTSGVKGHGNHGPQPNSPNFFPLHHPTFSREGGTQLPGRGCGGACFPWIQWLIRGGVEGSSIVPSIACPEIPGQNQKKGPGIARAGITGVGGSVGYAAFQNPISVLP